MENGLRRHPFLPYLVLLRVGFAMRRALLRDRCALTAPFHPYRFNSRAPQRLAPASPSRPVRAERLSPFGSPRSRTSQAPRACACLAFASGSKANWLSPFTYVRRYIFCGTFRRATPAPRRNAILKHPPGRYPAHCSAEFGLSSLWIAQPGKPGVHEPDSDHPVRHQLSIL